MVVAVVVVVLGVVVVVVNVVVVLVVVVVGVHLRPDQRFELSDMVVQADFM